MSSLFQGLCDASGKLLTVSGPAEGYHRGLAITSMGVVAEDFAAQPLTFVGGVAMDAVTGALLLSSGAPVAVAPGGLAVDAKGVVCSDSVIDVVHQGVGLDNGGKLAAGEMLLYNFNGTNAHALMTDWIPSGQNFQISAKLWNRTSATGARYIVSNDAATVWFGSGGTGNRSIETTYRYGSGVSEQVESLHQPGTDEQFMSVMDCVAGKITVRSAGFTSAESVNSWDNAEPNNRFDVIGAAVAGTPVSLWNGFIWDLKLTDNDNPSNSRHYPMNEGDGNTFFDVLNGQNATIQNYSAGNWQAPP